MSTFDITVTGIPEAQAMLAKWTDPELTKRAQRATSAGAKVMKVPLQLAVMPLSKRMAWSVYIHVAKRDKPATVLGHHVSKAFFWAMVIGGTKAHSLTSRKGGPTKPTVRGVKPHPVVAQIAAEYGDRALQAVIDDLAKDT